MRKVEKIAVPQVSQPHGNCGDCRFWAREFTQEMGMTQDGQMMNIEHLKKTAAASFKLGNANLNPMNMLIATATSAACWRHPQWQMQPDNHYCADFAAYLKPVTQ